MRAPNPLRTQPPAETVTSRQKVEDFLGRQEFLARQRAIRSWAERLGRAPEAIQDARRTVVPPIDHPKLINEWGGFQDLGGRSAGGSGTVTQFDWWKPPGTSAWRIPEVTSEDEEDDEDPNLSSVPRGQGSKRTRDRRRKRAIGERKRLKLPWYEHESPPRRYWEDRQGDHRRGPPGAGGVSC